MMWVVVCATCMFLLSCLVMCRHWALRRSATMEKVNWVHTDGLAGSGERRTWRLGPRDRWRRTMHPIRLPLGDIVDKKVYMWRRRGQCWPSQNGGWPSQGGSTSTWWSGNRGRAVTHVEIVEAYIADTWLQLVLAVSASKPWVTGLTAGMQVQIYILNHWVNPKNLIKWTTMTFL